MSRTPLLCVLAVAGAAHAADVYKVTVQRVGQDLYQVRGQDTIIKTRYCYKYATSDDAVLRLDSRSGFTIGKLFFEDGESCDVEKILGG